MPLECRSLLLTHWHQWVEALKVGGNAKANKLKKPSEKDVEPWYNKTYFFPSCPGHTVPKAFARSVVLKFSLTPALVIVCKEKLLDIVQKLLLNKLFNNIKIHIDWSPFSSRHRMESLFSLQQGSLLLLILQCICKPIAHIYSTKHTRTY